MLRPFRGRISRWMEISTCCDPSGVEYAADRFLTHECSRQIASNCGCFSGVEIAADRFLIQVWSRQIASNFCNPSEIDDTLDCFQTPEGSQQLVKNISVLIVRPQRGRSNVRALSRPSITTNSAKPQRTNDPIPLFLRCIPS